MTPTFSVAADLASIVRPRVIWWTGARVVGHEPRLDSVLAEAESRLRATAPPETGAVRAMYKRVGLDPTKTRPSSEALLRRVRKGDPLPRINSMVDVINWCSVEFQLPYGLYDAARIEGEVTLRLGRKGETYAGIRKDAVHVGGRIVVADAPGPFGNPTSDSARTMVTLSTTEVLVLVYAPADTPQTQLDHVVRATEERIAEMCGGRPVSPGARR